MFVYVFRNCMVGIARRILTLTFLSLLLFIYHPLGNPDGLRARRIPAKREVGSLAIPTAYKPNGSQPRGDLVRVGRGDLDFFRLRLFSPYFVLRMPAEGCWQESSVDPCSGRQRTKERTKEIREEQMKEQTKQNKQWSEQTNIE